jgi:hypothetical protein
MPDVRSSDSVAHFPTKPDLAQERRRAKDLLKAVRQGDDGRGRETVIGPASRLSSLTASALASMPVPVADCHDALAACNRQDAPLAWSRAQTDLGYALFSLHGGPTNTDTAKIAEAVAAYRAALEECTARARATRLGKASARSRRRAPGAWRTPE